MELVKRYFRKNRGFLAFLLVMLFVRATLANQYLVPSGSMIPSLQVGDMILVDRTAYDLKIPLTQISVAKTSEPQRGDVVVFDSVEEEGTVMVKRLIGLPGDEIEVIDGNVKVNGATIAQMGTVTSDQDELIQYEERLGEHRYFVQRIPEYFRPEQRVFEIPEGQYLMMGDNRDNSRDGRYFGFVPRKHLIGRAERVLYSWKFIGDRVGKAIP
jgi:signal peptidase I